MPVIIITIASFFGISAVRLIAYAAIGAAVIAGGLTIRQHYINQGWYAHKAAVEKQDNIAVGISKKVEAKTSTCEEQGGYWDVLTKGCKLEEVK